MTDGLGAGDDPVREAVAYAVKLWRHGASQALPAYTAATTYELVTEAVCEALLSFLPADPVVGRGDAGRPSCPPRTGRPFRLAERRSLHLKRGLIRLHAGAHSSPVAAARQEARLPRQPIAAVLGCMALEAADLLSSALVLPGRERPQIAHQLLSSLDEGADADAAEAWIAEPEQRAPEVRSGSVATEEWATVKARPAERWRRR